MKVVLLETVVWEALALIQPGVLGVKLYIRAKTSGILPHCESKLKGNYLNYLKKNYLQSYKDK